MLVVVGEQERPPALRLVVAFAATLRADESLRQLLLLEHTGRLEHPSGGPSCNTRQQTGKLRLRRVTRQDRARPSYRLLRDARAAGGLTFRRRRIKLRGLGLGLVGALPRLS